MVSDNQQNSNLPVVSPIYGQTPMQGGLSVNINDQKPDIEVQKYFSDEDILKLPLQIALCGWIKHVDLVKSRLDKKNRAAKFLSRFTKPEYKVYYAPSNDPVKAALNRLCNEYCVDFMFNSIYPLITRITQSSRMPAIQIYNLWNSKITTLIYALNDGYDVMYYCKECKRRVDEYHADIMSKKIVTSKFVSYNKKTHLPMYKTNVDVKLKHHVDVYENTFDINPDFCQDIITDICLYSGITSKAEKGFFLRELRETFLSTSQVQPQFQQFADRINDNRSGGIVKAFRRFSGVEQ